jgi:hypothetical protein
MILILLFPIVFNKFSKEILSTHIGDIKYVTLPNAFQCMAYPIKTVGEAVSGCQGNALNFF